MPPAQWVPEAPRPYYTGHFWLDYLYNNVFTEPNEWTFIANHLPIPGNTDIHIDIAVKRRRDGAHALHAYCVSRGGPTPKEAEQDASRRSRAALDYLRPGHPVPVLTFSGMLARLWLAAPGRDGLIPLFPDDIPQWQRDLSESSYTADYRYIDSSGEDFAQWFDWIKRRRFENHLPSTEP